MPLRARLPAAAAAAGCALALAACGGPDERPLETSLREAVDAALDDGGAYSTSVAAACRGGGAERACDVGVVTAGGGVEERYRVHVADDGCWRAERVGLGVASGRDAGAAAPRTLRGCAR